MIELTGIESTLSVCATFLIVFLTVFGYSVNEAGNLYSRYELLKKEEVKPLLNKRILNIFKYLGTEITSEDYEIMKGFFITRFVLENSDEVYSNLRNVKEDVYNEILTFIILIGIIFFLFILTGSGNNYLQAIWFGYILVVGILSFRKIRLIIKDAMKDLENLENSIDILNSYLNNEFDFKDLE